MTGSTSATQLTLGFRDTVYAGAGTDRVSWDAYDIIRENEIEPAGIARRETVGAARRCSALAAAWRLL